jgi:signal peptidase I
MIGDLFFSDPRYYLHHEPRRGDVAVFRYPHDTTVDYVKRIVGLPGDRIAFEDGRLIIDGTIVERRPVGKFEYSPDPSGTTPERLDRFVETLPGGPSYDIPLRRAPTPDETMAEVIVPPDHYFVVGDNRDHSNDSRRLDDVGFLPRENLTARPKFIYWSRSWSRIGMAVR